MTGKLAPDRDPGTPVPPSIPEARRLLAPFFNGVAMIIFGRP
jgi:hypothetical protein